MRNLCFIKTILAFVFMCASSAFAFTDGDFSRVCYAPNWITGEEELVYEQNVGDVLGGYHAFASRQNGGKWLIQYNIVKMLREPIPTRKFTFYHECAHAMFNTSSEEIADCEGLRSMIEDSNVTNRDIALIADTYVAYGRVFPPPGCDY